MINKKLLKKIFLPLLVIMVFVIAFVASCNLFGSSCQYYAQKHKTESREYSFSHITKEKKNSLDDTRKMIALASIKIEEIKTQNK